MENVYEISLLLDFYGQLLTARQYEILDMHYNNDYSLGEIAEELGISRQGVFDNVKRGKAALNDLEQKLGLVRKFSGQKQKAEELLKYIESTKLDIDNDTFSEKLNRIEDIVTDIINGI